MDWNDSYRGDGTDTTPLDEQLLTDALKTTPGKALDLGCGAGGNAIGLASRGWTVTGIDSATKAIDSARIAAELAGVEVTFQVADITSWKPDETYDLVISSYALPPKGTQRDAALATARSALAPGGMIVIGEWDADNTVWGSPEIFVTVGEMADAMIDLDIVRNESVATRPHDHPGHGHHEDHAIPTGSQPRAVITVARKPLN